MTERYTVVWSRTAQDDLDGILEFVSRHDGLERAVALYETLSGRVKVLGTYPRRGRVVPELGRLGLRDFREALVGPYRIIFRLDQQTVALLGVLDGRRDLSELLVERALRAI